jgi:dipeptide/tripeptide permease
MRPPFNLFIRSGSMNSGKAGKEKFPSTFWTANSIELFERAAYYSMTSFMVIYLKETLGMRPVVATLLNGSLLWGLIYFLPILAGTLADKYGFKRSLTVAFVMISLGYFTMGSIQEFWPGFIGKAEAETIDYTVPAVLGILLIGIGGSIVKPCIAGTIQKTAGTRATLGFGIFYMVINIGSITGRGVGYFIRKNIGIPAIFTHAASLFAIVGLVLVLFLYREPEYVSDGKKDEQKVQKKTFGQAIGGIFVVLRSPRFVFFIIVIGLFWSLYTQIYNLIPLFLRHIDPEASVELYTLTNPVTIVLFQLAVTRMVKRWTPIKSVILGAVVMTIGMLVNSLPPLLFADLSEMVTFPGFTMPIAGIFLVGSIAVMAFGEMMASPRIYEYLGAIAPKGEEGLYLGYANLPVAIGSVLSGLTGGALFEHFIATPQKAGRPIHSLAIWLIISGMGVLSIVGLAIYDRLLGKAAKK